MDAIALCMEHAKGTAGMVLHAAAAMDENRAGKRHDVRAGGLDSCFRADVAGGRLPAAGRPQFPSRPLSSEELAAARSSSVLAAAFLNDMAMARLLPVSDGLGDDGVARGGRGLFAACGGGGFECCCCGRSAGF